jgi:hypothetical protein
VHHRRRSLTAALLGVLALVLALTAGACSDDDKAPSGSASNGAADNSDGTGGAASFPGGTRSSLPKGGDGEGSGESGGSGGTPSSGTGDPSEGIPLDQFCRGYAEVRGSQQAISDAVSSNRLGDLKTAYRRLTDAYLAMAENPPDDVYDEIRAVAMLYDELDVQVSAATAIDQVKAIALQAESGDRADDLAAVRDYGTEHC